jgi:tetratricopeptide (TPR) repeat protein
LDKERKRHLPLNSIIMIGLSILVLFAYQGVMGNDFINYDDPAYVTENRYVKGGISVEGVKWAFTTSYVSNWHPLTWVSLMVDRQLFGMNPSGYHWTNVILHLSGGLLLFGVLNRMTGYPWRSALVASLFLLHPLHVESVAWVAERKDVLSALFWMLGMWGYVRYVLKPDFRRYACVIFYFVLGLLSKPMVVTFPFVLLLLDYWPLGRMLDGKTAIFRLLYEKIPLFILSAASCVITFLVQKDGEAVASLQLLPFAHRIGNALVAYAHYLVKTVWPVNLAVFYPHPGVWPPREILLAFALLLLIGLFVMMKMKRFPYLAFGWLWYLGTLVPVIGLVQVGAQAMADRYTYLPLIGIFVMVAWAGADILIKAKTGGAIGGIVSGGLIVVLIVMTQTQVGYWKNSLTLFMHAQNVTDKNYQAQNNIGLALAAEHKYEEATEYYREAMKSDPYYMSACYNLGLARMEQGRLEEAMRSFLDALRIKPGDESVLFSRGVLFARMGRWDEAIGDYRSAVKKDPYNAALHNNLGVVLINLKRRDEAIQEYQEAIRLNPEHAGAHNNLAMLLIGKGQTNEGIAHFRQAILYQPSYAHAHYQLGLVLQNLGRADEALYHMTEAKRINPEIDTSHSKVDPAQLVGPDEMMKKSDRR